MMMIVPTTTARRAIQGIGRRLLSSKKTTVKDARTTSPWKLMIKVWKWGRFPLVGFSIYNFGYMKGLIDYAQDPDKKDQELFMQVLDGQSVVGIRDVEDSSRQRAQLVTDRIVAAAQSYTQEQLTKARSDMLTSSSEDQNEEVKFWQGAVNRVKGRWIVVLVDSPVPNAFVSQLLPQRIFITSEMLEKLITNDDELALTLGHELSHQLHGHMESQIDVTFLLLSIELFLLAIDPTDGALTVAFVYGLQQLRNMLTASLSRESEREADETGIILTARACFDTFRGSQLMLNLYKNEQQNASSPIEKAFVKANRWLYLDTHPPSHDRFVFLSQKSIHENAQKYKDSTCATIQSSFQQAVHLLKTKRKQYK